GFIFEWRDEWWKYKQTENLDIQDTTASWVNGAYKFDHVEGQNNMNEEWFGITRLGEMDAQGVHPSEPRMAYYTMKDIFNIDLYQTDKADMNRSFRNLDLATHEVRGEIELLKSKERRSESFKLSGGSFTGEYFVKAFEEETTENGENGLRWTDGQMLDLDFEFQPSNRLRGEFTINLLANVAESDFEFRYGDRGLPITVEVVETTEVSPDSTGTVAVSRSEADITDNERIEIYDFQATYSDENYDLNAFYHVPRYHWMYEGDFFGLLRETTDLTGSNGQDIWNAKAPYGFEYVGKKSTDGLKVVVGPEVYWGANPKAIIKYEFAKGDIDFAVMHAEDIAQRETSASATEATERQTRQTTVYAETMLSDTVTMELGGIIASTEKVGDTFDRLEGDNIVVDEIDDEDTLGIKGKFTFDVSTTTEAYLGFNYAGLVADGGATLKEWGTQLPYSELGNKKEIDGGIRMAFGDYTVYPRFLVRENIVDANPVIDPVTLGTTIIPGLAPRNRDSDPFAVLDNREAESFEVFFTYDPTPASWFYNWDVDMKEDAAFAYNVGIIATNYDTATDANLFFFEEGGTNASFGEGLPAEEVWLLKSKMIFNPRSGLRHVLNLTAGKQQSTGAVRDADGEFFETVEFFAVDGKTIIDNTHIWSGYIKVDDFGPYDFQRQFNQTFPLQLKLEYTRLLDQFKDEDISSKWGVKGLYRELDELSGEDYEDGENDSIFEVQTYYEVTF
nr:hypothetical protein [Gammaproteobacteria bacterium]